MKSKDVKTTSTQDNTIPDWLSSAAAHIATGVTNSPEYRPYTGELAPGMASNQSLANTLMPGLLGQGSNLIQLGVPGASAAANFTAPQLTAGGVNDTVTGLLSPYTKNVVDTTNNEIDRAATIQQQKNDAAAAAAHVFNGDRAGITAAENARNFNTIKANTDASLYDTAYKNALTGAINIGQGNQAAAINGAYTNAAGANAIGNLGNLVQNANISDISGLLGTGAVAQQTQAAKDTAGYNANTNNFLIPAQLQQILGGALNGLPHDTHMNGTQTTPVSSNAGMGLLGAGLSLLTAPLTGGTSLLGMMGSGLMGGLGGAAAGAMSAPVGVVGAAGSMPVPTFF